MQDRNLSLTSKGDHELITNPGSLRPKMKPEISPEIPINDSDDAVWETMFFHTDIYYDFKSNNWIWNSTNELVRDFEWDNNNEFDAFYPYMQDAVCVLIKPDFVRHQIFVSDLRGLG